MNTSQPIHTFRRVPGIALGLLLFVAPMWRGSQAAELDTNSFHVGFTQSLFTEINEGDAKAAVKAWVQIVAKDRGIPINPDSSIFQSTEELLRALQDKQVDAVGVSTVEYAAAIRTVPLSPIFVTYHDGETRDQYLVLVRRDSHLDRLTDLQGRSLALHSQARTCMAIPWLDTQLLKDGAKPTTEWVGKITQYLNISQVVLPVFFHKCDACVADRAEFATMCELNPQIGQQLKIIARSPEMVTALFCFRAEYQSEFKEKIFAGLENLNKTPAGQQTLTIFQSDRTAAEPASCMDSALAILAARAQLIERVGVTNAAAASPPAGAPQTARVATP